MAKNTSSKKPSSRVNRATRHVLPRHGSRPHPAKKGGAPQGGYSGHPDVRPGDDIRVRPGTARGQKWGPLAGRLPRPSKRTLKKTGPRSKKIGVQLKKSLKNWTKEDSKRR